jgi:hypothetical protein
MVEPDDFTRECLAVVADKSIFRTRPRASSIGSLPGVVRQR